MAIDPICGMTVDESTPCRAETEGRTYYFCCERCRKKFTGELAPVAAAADAVYTCPMHLEVEQIGPGICPKCGMALEPRDAEPGSLAKWRSWASASSAAAR